MGDNHSFQNKRHIFYTERFEIHSERLQAIQNDLKIIQNVLYQNCIPLPIDEDNYNAVKLLRKSLTDEDYKIVLSGLKI